MDLVKWPVMEDPKLCTNIAIVRFCMDPTPIRRQLNNWRPPLINAKRINSNFVYERKIVKNTCNLINDREKLANILLFSQNNFDKILKNDFVFEIVEPLVGFV